MSQDLQTYLAELSSDLEQAQTQSEKLEYMIELGRQLELAPDLAKDQSCLVPGCASHTYAKIQEKNDKIEFLVYTDSHITKGYLLILKKALDDQANKDYDAIKQILLQWFAQTGLETASLATRTNIAGRVLDFVRP